MVHYKEVLKPFSGDVLNTSAKPLRILKGAQIGKDIYFTDAVGIAVILGYCHEAGHIIGDKLSFKKREVLTPDEAREALIFRKWLSYQEVKDLFNTTRFEGTKETPVHKVVIPIANALLKVFTKDWFDESMVNFHPVTTPFEIDELIKQALREGKKCPSGIKLGHDGELLHTSNKAARDAEIPAMVTEYGCLYILANSIRQYHPTFASQYVVTATSASQRRARLIVERAYEGENWVLPSAKDLLKAKD